MKTNNLLTLAMIQGGKAFFEGFREGINKVMKENQMKSIERQKEQEKRKTDLRKYRRIQAALAIERDNNLCVFCYFIDGKKTKRDDIHHFYGRGRKAGDWREHYTNLVCTCRACHPLPIQDHTSEPELEAILEMANNTPINKSFKGPINE